MEPAIYSKIRSAEEKLLPELYNYCKNLFAGHHIPSHDHNHHLRVWRYAREVILSLTPGTLELTEEDIGQLMLAVFFHDTGLTVTLDENHGLESAKICREYLSLNKEFFSFRPLEAIRAIELHDKKDIWSSAGSVKIPDIPIIVSLCDDLDAYGPVGVLRYAEIYLLRGVSFGDLPGRVLSNLDHRFRLLSGQEWLSDDFVSRHEVRYNLARNFYKALQLSDSTAKKDIILSYMDFVNHQRGNLPGFVAELTAGKNNETCGFGRELLRDLEDPVTGLSAEP